MNITSSTVLLKTDLFKSFYIASPNTVTTQTTVPFSHLTWQLPSVFLFQRHVLAMWRPAPTRCIITQVTETYRERTPTSESNRGWHHITSFASCSERARSPRECISFLVDSAVQ